MNRRVVLLCVIAATGCNPLPPSDDKYFVGSANIARASVLREIDNSSVYDGCWVVGTTTCRRRPSSSA